MGVPTFFKELVSKHKDTYFGIRNGKQVCDYFFIDYNGIVYNVFYALRKKITGTNMSKNAIETLLVDEVVKYTQYMVNEVVKPRKLLFFSFDGPAPRMKMVQQRSRRFKGVQTSLYKKERMKVYKLPEELDWDPSPNISPGTEFMEKLSNKLLEVSKKKGFVGSNDPNVSLQVLLSNSNVAGEGEHKFMPIIRNMRKNKSESNASIFIYGKDADLIILAMATHKSNITIMRDVANEVSLQNEMKDFEFVGLNIDKCRSYFHKSLTKNYNNPNIDEIRVMNDYNFLTFLVGNDFVISLPFFKIRRGGLERLQQIYNQIRGKYNDYLIDYHPDTQPKPLIQHDFLKEIFEIITAQEQELLTLQQKNIEKIMKGGRNTRFDREEEKTPIEIDMNRYDNWEVCAPGHPLYEMYKDDFKKVDYKQDMEVWKEQYYKHFVGISYENKEEFDNVVDDMCVNYLESLVFTLQYYLTGCPSWTWHYRYRVSPFPSDVLRILESKITNINDITFTLGKPYTPYEQLLLILPPQMNEIIPKALRPIMTDPKMGCSHYYPATFRLDVLDGLKTMYSEAILPEIDESVLLKKYGELEGELTEAEKVRNTIRGSAFLIK